LTKLPEEFRNLGYGVIEEELFNFFFYFNNDSLNDFGETLIFVLTSRRELLLALNWKSKKRGIGVVENEVHLLLLWFSVCRFGTNLFDRSIFGTQSTCM